MGRNMENNRENPEWKKPYLCTHAKNKTPGKCIEKKWNEAGTADAV